MKADDLILASFFMIETQSKISVNILYIYRFHREEFEPCSFFNYKPGGEKVWLTREDIRRLEVALKNRFLEWLVINPERANKVLQQIGRNVENELDFRSKPFDQV